MCPRRGTDANVREINSELRVSLPRRRQEQVSNTRSLNSEAQQEEAASTDEKRDSHHAGCVPTVQLAASRPYQRLHSAKLGRSIGIGPRRIIPHTASPIMRGDREIKPNAVAVTLFPRSRPCDDRLAPFLDCLLVGDEEACCGRGHHYRI